MPWLYQACPLSALVHSPTDHSPTQPLSTVPATSRATKNGPSTCPLQRLLANQLPWLKSVVSESRCPRSLHLTLFPATIPDRGLTSVLFFDLFRSIYILSHL